MYRAFSALDRYSESECQSLMRRIRANYSTWKELFPLAGGCCVGVAWAVGWVFASGYVDLSRIVPLLPAGTGERVIAVIVTSVGASLLTFYVLRDVVLFFGVRQELRRTDCKKCGQSLLGLRLDYRGIDADPGNIYVRCAECGRAYRLLDIGLSPKDLLPPGSEEEYLAAGKPRRM